MNDAAHPLLKKGDEISGFRWVIIAFILSSILIVSLVVWQLIGIQSRHWCEIPGADEMLSEGCFSLMGQLIQIKASAVIGLLFILGITVIAIVAVTLRVKIDADGPGGTGVTIGGERPEEIPSWESAYGVDDIEDASFEVKPPLGVE